MKNKYLHQGRLLFFILLVMILTPFAFDEYAASLPHMATALHTSGSIMQLSITVFMLTLAFSQMVCGILSDHFGRRNVLLACIGIFIAGTLVCISAHNYQILLLGRVIQGIGCGLPNVYPSIVIGEAIEPKNVNKVASYYLLGYSLIPIIAPVLGGYLQQYFHWQANFWFLFTVGVIVLVPCILKLPETHTPTHEDKFTLKSTITKYKKVLGNMEWFGATLSGFFLWSPVIIFSVIAPFLLQNKLGMTASGYGKAALFVGLGFLIGNSLNSFLNKMELCSQRTMILSGFAIWIITAIIQLIVLISGHITVVSVIAPVFIMMIGISLTWPAVYAIALSATDLPGIAGSLINTVVLLCVALSTAIISAFHVQSAVTFVEILLCFSFAAVATYALSQISAKQRKKVSLRN